MAEYYVIVDVKIDKPEEYKEYMVHARPAVEKFGGEYLVRGGDFNVVEGTHLQPRRLVLLKFPSKQNFDEFYASDAYQKARAIRLPLSDMTMIGVEGFAG
ncbi:DUF1330 domain-containing protein [Maritalea sp.]|jgi:uncharacterized protein (DUF1330 family)|uniref:DUF1330 domain-containing protein n=1 Tax=Maritalea sp. TaxID=2003361 RepID=UPI0039E2791A